MTDKPGFQYEPVIKVPYESQDLSDCTEKE